ncbi:DUF927 domain-containing protein [Anaerovibrio slackiae]|uniref:DUF927 domain-containing protein n=1 Tax=Anaerovibrio slackiae TaxID=2652309 RepID=UPI0038661B5E
MELTQLSVGEVEQQPVLQEADEDQEAFLNVEDEVLDEDMLVDEVSDDVVRDDEVLESNHGSEVEENSYEEPDTSEAEMTCDVVPLPDEADNVTQDDDNYVPDEVVEEYGLSQEQVDDIASYNLTVLKCMENLSDRQVYIEFLGLNWYGNFVTFMLKSSEAFFGKLFEMLLDKGVDVDLMMGKEEKIAYCNAMKESAKRLGQSCFLYDGLGYQLDAKGERKYFPDFAGENYDYAGDVDIKTSGRAKNWASMYNKWVSGHAKLELVVAIALTAPVIYRINQFQPIGNFLVSFIGESSTGKTTALQLALSIYGKPTRGNGGLMDTLHGTVNAITNSIRKKNGFLNGFDEATGTLLKSGKASEIWNNMIYDFSTGEDKKRMRSDLSMNERSCCYSTTIFTSELSIIESLNNSIEGQAVRLLEIEGGFTDTPEQSNEIKKLSLANYGWIAGYFVRRLEKLDDDDLRELYEACKKRLADKTSVDSRYRTRILETLAVVLVAAKIVNEVAYKGKPMPIEIDEEMLIESLVEVSQSAVPKELTAEMILDTITNNLLKAKASKAGYSDKCGTLTSLPDGTLEAFIVTDYFKKWLNEAGGGSKSERSLISKLAEAGVLVLPKDKSHKTFQRKIGDLTVRGYLLKFKSQENVEKELKKSVKHRKKKEKKTLLKDDD